MRRQMWPQVCVQKIGFFQMQAASTLVGSPPTMCSIVHIAFSHSAATSDDVDEAWRAWPRAQQMASPIMAVFPPEWQQQYERVRGEWQRVVKPSY